MQFRAVTWNTVQSGVKEEKEKKEYFINKIELSYKKHILRGDSTPRALQHCTMLHSTDVTDMWVWCNTCSLSVESKSSSGTAKSIPIPATDTIRIRLEGRTVPSPPLTPPPPFTPPPTAPPSFTPPPTPPLPPPPVPLPLLLLPSPVAAAADEDDDDEGNDVIFSRANWSASAGQMIGSLTKSVESPSDPNNNCNMKRFVDYVVAVVNVVDDDDDDDDDVILLYYYNDYHYYHYYYYHYH